jgi:hypothetical protein
MLVSGTAVIGGVNLAAGADPLFVDWTSMLPSFTTAYDPSSENDCTAGRAKCVDITIKEMQRRFDALGQACNHNGVFGLAYLRTTQTYKWARDVPGFFDDPAFVNHEDAVFAEFYFDAYDSWAKGDRAAVPPAWLIAFDAAKNRTVTGTGDLLLGMSAHVNRDLPFVLAAIGLTYPDGTSRKADHDKVNQFLNAVVDPLLAEEAARFDPSMSTSTPGSLGSTAFFQMLAAWREQAWRNAEALVNAPTAADRAMVAQQIEDFAATEAAAIVAGQAYLPPLTTSAGRDTYCGVHNGDAAPMAYAFGQPPAW